MSEKTVKRMYMSLIGIGGILMTLACLDKLDLISKLFYFSMDFEISNFFLHTFIFRTSIETMGGIFILIGMLIYKKESLPFRR